MGDKPSDNRRRISDNLLNEIEEFDGKDFSEQLLKWKNSSDTLSEKELEEKFDRAMNRFENKLQNPNDDIRDTLSKEDVKEAVREALPSGVY